MRELFGVLLEMSLAASYGILVLILFRPLLKKAPRVLSYALWSVVGLRLVIPFSFERMFSLLPGSVTADVVLRNVINLQNPEINRGGEGVNFYVSEGIKASGTEAGVNPWEMALQIGTYIWIAGIIVLLMYYFISIRTLKKQLSGAQKIDGKLYEAENLHTPFVFGILRPAIYLPTGLGKEEKTYILLHEQIHIRRRDPLMKMIGFMILTIHWFNPLVWLSYRLMSQDMEYSCDERVLKELDFEKKKSYATTLLSLSTERQAFTVRSLAFGEGNVKGRIKHVLNYKKPSFMVILISMILGGILAIILMTSYGEKNLIRESEPNEAAEAREVVEHYFQAVEARDEEQLLATLTERHHGRNVQLIGEETITLTSIDYTEDDSERNWYVTNGRGQVNGTEPENVMVFRVSFEVEYPEGMSGASMKGNIRIGEFFLIREEKGASWLIDDQGY